MDRNDRRTVPFFIPESITGILIDEKGKRDII